jgi:hypothetical protein
MKQRIARTLLLCMALFSVSGVGMLFADENTINLESKVVALSPEMGPDGTPLFGTWHLDWSKFSTKGFPVLATDVKSWPVAVYGTNPKAPVKSLGVAMLFDRKEYNWIDLIPGSAEKPIEIPLPGRVKAVDMWVWSGNFNYYLQAFVRDYKGIVYTIDMGNLDFVGWKNLRINIPDSVPQSKKYLPKRENLTLVKFRIWTRPTEVVVIPGVEPSAADIDKAVKFYFNSIKVLTDTFETLFDGDDLADPSATKDAWGSAGTK